MSCSSATRQALHVLIVGCHGPWCHCCSIAPIPIPHPCHLSCIMVAVHNVQKYTLFKSDVRQWNQDACSPGV
jgi:hypothetical protein